MYSCFGDFLYQLSEFIFQSESMQQRVERFIQGLYKADRGINIKMEMILRDTLNIIHTVEQIIQTFRSEFLNENVSIKLGTKKILILWKQFQDSMKDASKLRRTLRLVENEVELVRKDLIGTLKANQDLRNSLLGRETPATESAGSDRILRDFSRQGIEFSARQRNLLSSPEKQRVFIDL